jgi:uncharacterized protein YndB with AHSA1/START domain
MADNQAPQFTTTRLGERELVLERHFTAPRPLVWRVWTEPEHVARWWPPTGYHLPVCTIDLRPGGIWRYCMQSLNGQDEHWVQSVYGEIVAPERLVYTTVFTDEQANLVKYVPEQFSYVSLVEEAGRTKCTIQVQFTSADALQVALNMGMREGFAETLNNLESLLQSM